MAGKKKKLGLFDKNNKGMKPLQNFLLAIILVLGLFLLFSIPELTASVFHFVWSTAPFWLAFFAGRTFIKYWVKYRRMIFLRKQGSVLLEIKIPKEILKSPLAMEIVITSLYQTGSATYLETYFKGKVKPWFSFEMISEEGKIRFFIWTWEKFKDLVESQLYAQYPGIEITEREEDYTDWYEQTDPTWMSFRIPIVKQVSATFM